ncbi:MAG: epoxyqueuosine reductase QueH [Oscillospiraceae bacterium]|nr:epoxyqueuosine reductase QueH [Oscillospiraceae bacterium]
MNYQKELEGLLSKIDPTQPPPTLLLHSCCAPCSSYVLEYLSAYFEITVFYYNPNIYPETEYHHRVEEQKRFIEQIPHKHPIHFVEGVYDTSRFYTAIKGLEGCKEGEDRCFVCYGLRLEEAALLAAAHGFAYFTTTLSISPHKNAQKLNEIGFAMQEKYHVTHLPADFKKRDGYKRSVALSEAYGLYRQNYCGCIFSRQSQESALSET